MPKSGKRAGLRETPLDASDLDGDPLKQFAAWFQPRAGSGVPEAHAMTLATATKDGSPFARTSPRGSQLSAWASRQSERLESREALERRVTELDGQYAGREVPRPPFWGGFRLVPERFEVWQGRSSRLHDRFCYSRDGGRWVIERLAP